jgi:hypothetical protein
MKSKGLYPKLMATKSKKGCFTVQARYFAKGKGYCKPAGFFGYFCRHELATTQ